jgi:hypothetical protein
MSFDEAGITDLIDHIRKVHLGVLTVVGALLASSFGDSTVLVRRAQDDAMAICDFGEGLR